MSASRFGRFTTRKETGSWFDSTAGTDVAAKRKIPSHAGNGDPFAHPRY